MDSALEAVELTADHGEELAAACIAAVAAVGKAAQAGIAKASDSGEGSWGFTGTAEGSSNQAGGSAATVQSARGAGTVDGGGGLTAEGERPVLEPADIAASAASLGVQHHVTARRGPLSASGASPSAGPASADLGGLDATATADVTPCGS